MKKENEKYIQTLKPTVWIGKNGFNDEIAEELMHQLKARGVVKVKWLSSADMDELDAKELAGLVHADLIGIRGKTAVLSAKNRPVSSPAVRKSPVKSAQSRRAEVLRRSLLRK